MDKVLFTPPAMFAEHEWVDAIDYFGQPYKKCVTVNRHHKDLGYLWEQFREHFNASVENTNEINRRFGGNMLSINAKAVEDHFEQELLNPHTRL